MCDIRNSTEACGTLRGSSPMRNSRSHSARITRTAFARYTGVMLIRDSAAAGRRECSTSRTVDAPRTNTNDGEEEGDAAAASTPSPRTEKRPSVPQATLPPLVQSLEASRPPAAAAVVPADGDASAPPIMVKCTVCRRSRRTPGSTRSASSMTITMRLRS